MLGGGRQWKDEESRSVWSQEVAGGFEELWSCIRDRTREVWCCHRTRRIRIHLHRTGCHTPARESPVARCSSHQLGINGWATMQNWAPKGCLTIAFCYYLSNCIQALFGTAGFEFKFDEENRNRTKRLEVILHPAFSSDTTFDNGFGQVPKSKVEYRDKTIKNLRANFDFVYSMKSWLTLTGDRNRDLVSSVSCSIGGPYCTSIISISCTMDLKSAVGMRERWSSKVLTSLSLRLVSSPTNDAMDTYLTLENLTSMRSS